MVDVTLTALQDKLGKDPRYVYGGAPGAWQGHGRTYRAITPLIDVKAFNDATDAADRIDAAGDSIHLFEVQPNMVVLNSTVIVERTAGAQCTIDVRMGTTVVHNDVDVNSLGGKSATPSAPTPGGVVQQVNVLFNHAPGNVRFWVALLMIDVSREDVDA